MTDLEKTMQEGPSTGWRHEMGCPASCGQDLAAVLEVKLGDSVNLVTPKATLTPGGMIRTARSQRARVAGIFNLGLLEFDSQWGFVALDFAQELAGITGPELFQLRVADPFDAPAVAARITTQLGDAYTAQHWQDLNRALFSALWLEKMAITGDAR